MDFIKGLYEEGLTESKLDEDAWADIRARRIGRLSDQRRIALYGYLVGIENAARAKRFIEEAEKGNAIPSNFVKAYRPIIEMIDDIVESGPGGITLLKQLHKRVKKG
jgi:plasmid stabilization system protein ParE